MNINCSQISLGNERFSTMNYQGNIRIRLNKQNLKGKNQLLKKNNLKDWYRKLRMMQRLIAKGNKKSMKV